MRIQLLTLVIDYIHPVIENKNQSNPRELNLLQIIFEKNLFFKSFLLKSRFTLSSQVVINNLDKNHYN